MTDDEFETWYTAQLAKHGQLRTTPPKDTLTPKQRAHNTRVKQRDRKRTDQVQAAADKHLEQRAALCHEPSDTLKQDLITHERKKRVAQRAKERETNDKEPKHAVHAKRYEINDEFLTLRQVVERYGVSRQTFNYRIKELGMTPTEAATVPATSIRYRQKAKVYDVYGTPMTVTEIANRYNISRPTLWKRLSCGLNVERAIELGAKEVGRRAMRSRSMHYDGWR